MHSLKSSSQKLSSLLRRRVVCGLACGLATTMGAGCATTMVREPFASAPPPDLVTARASYAHAAAAPARELDPAGLLAAKQALDKAEAVFRSEGQSDEARDLAYIADRKARLAEARAGILLAKTTTARTRASMSQMARAGEGQQVDAESQGRAPQDQPQRGMGEGEGESGGQGEGDRDVITLSGAVLFEFDEAQLLPAARAALDNVAEVLRAHPERRVRIEGHTDSRGSHAYNMNLSQERADAVREYLVSQGVAPDVTVAEGVGPDEPVADNDNPEGRANNRRVEVVLSPADAPADAP